MLNFVLIDYKGGGYNQESVADIIESALKILTDVKDSGDVRVIQTRRELGFAEEPPTETLVARQLRREKLECNAPSCSRLLGQVDAAHRSLAEERLHAKTGQDSAGTNLERHGLKPA